MEVSRPLKLPCRLLLELFAEELLLEFSWNIIYDKRTISVLMVGFTILLFENDLR